MFMNILEETRYISEVTNEENGKIYLLNIIKTHPTSGPMLGFICYDLYLTDPNPNHDLLVGIGHKAFTDDEYETEEARLDALQDIIATSLKGNYERVDKLLNQTF